MQIWFSQLVDFLHAQTHQSEVWFAWLHAEESDFIRFNQAKVRQAGNVTQRHLTLTLALGQRHASYQITLCGVLELDQALLRSALDTLRAQVPLLPEDPYLLYATEIKSSTDVGTNHVPAYQEVLGQVLEVTQGTDFVGIYAGGGSFIGFANSFGQCNWHARHSFNLDWSLYHRGDKAVKGGYAGFSWDTVAFQAKFAADMSQLAILMRPSRSVAPGEYRVYLAPAALREILAMLAEGSFGLQAHRNKQSPLLRMSENGQTLHHSIHLSENTASGISAAFQNQGFCKPSQVPLIQNGRYADSLISPRSAQEYGVSSNGANAEEFPESLDLAAGELAQAEILQRLENGIYINNLWYLNYSDPVICRLTGMTRFATFLVENGEISAPLNVMRFDDTVYAMLGENLIGLTQEREFLADPSTYHARSIMSYRLPGALVEGLRLTL